MKKVKFYALCCRNIFAVARHQRYIPKEDLVIVINTIDDDFKNEAVAYCTDNSIEYYVTESNGGPSKGKNSVFDLFQASDNDYMVLIDGDDFVTPHGVWTYKQLAQNDDCPDALALEHQWGIYADKGYSPAMLNLMSTGAVHAGNPGIGCSDPLDMDSIHGAMVKPFYRKESWWRDAMDGQIVKTVDGDDHSLAFHNLYKEWAKLCYKYISTRESHLRLVMFSKKLVNLNFRFNLDFRIGEDTLLYLDLKRAHLNGQIVMKHLFDRYPTYIYDQRIGGLVWNEKDAYGAENTTDYGWYLWLRKLTDEYLKYETNGIMSTDVIPRLTVKTHYVYEQTVDPDWYEGKVYTWDIEWPETYKPDLCNLVTFPGKKTVEY